MFCNYAGASVNEIIKHIECDSNRDNKILYLGEYQMQCLNNLEYNCIHLTRDYWGKALYFMGHEIIEVKNYDYLKLA